MFQFFFFSRKTFLFFVRPYRNLSHSPKFTDSVHTLAAQEGKKNRKTRRMGGKIKKIF